MTQGRTSKIDIKWARPQYRFFFGGGGEYAPPTKTLGARITAKIARYQVIKGQKIYGPLKPVIWTIHMGY